LGFHGLAASDEAAADQGALPSPDALLPENTESHADLAAIPAVFDAAAAGAADAPPAAAAPVQHTSQRHHVVLPVGGASAAPTAAATLQHASQAHHVVLPVVRRTRADETTRVRPIFQGRTLVVSAAGAAGMQTLQQALFTCLSRRFLD
jgi:hypothetical protein